MINEVGDCYDKYGYCNQRNAGGACLILIACRRTTFKVTISPVSEDEADELEFKSLKGIAGCPLDLDEVRKERLGF